MKTNIPILTITGSDSTGGSGVQADIKTISALGGYALSAITAITVQNTLGIQEFFNLQDNIVAGQIEAIINDIQPEVVKIGMIRSVGTLNAVVGALSKYKPRQTIYDPIVYSSRGDVLMADDVIAQVKCQLLPLIDLVIVRERDAAYFMRGKGSDTVGRDQIASWFGLLQRDHARRSSAAVCTRIGKQSGFGYCCLLGSGIANGRGPEPFQDVYESADTSRFRPDRAEQRTL